VTARGRQRGIAAAPRDLDDHQVPAGRDQRVAVAVPVGIVLLAIEDDATDAGAGERVLPPVIRG
jgi:hypothetical protein